MAVGTPIDMFAEDGCRAFTGSVKMESTDDGIECLKQIIADQRAAGTAPPKVPSKK